MYPYGNSVRQRVNKIQLKCHHRLYCGCEGCIHPCTYLTALLTTPIPQLIFCELVTLDALTTIRYMSLFHSQLMHHNLHWLDVPERVKYKVIILTRRATVSSC